MTTIDCKNDISIVVIAFRKPKHLIRTINSCLIQKSDKIKVEIILVNNNEFKSESYNYIRDIANMYKNDLKMVDTKIECNANIARNIGLEESAGEFIKYIDDDDILCASAIDNLYDEITKKNVDFVFGRIKHVKMNFKTKIFVFVFNCLMILNNCIFLKNNNLKKRLLISQKITKNPNTLSSIFKREFLIYNKWDETMIKSQDGELFLRISNIAEYSSITKKIGVYYHEAKAGTKKGKCIGEKSTLLLLDRNIEDINKLTRFEKFLCFYKFYLFGLPNFNSDYQKKVKLKFSGEK